MFSSKKNLIILGTTALLIIAIVIVMFVSLRPSPKYIKHCYNGVIDDGEEDIDCGGPCELECGAEQFPFQRLPTSIADVAVTDDFILIVDEMRHRILAYDKDSLKYVDTIGEIEEIDENGNVRFINGGKDDELFTFPCCITNGPDKDIYILDRFNQKIKIYSKELDYKSTINIPDRLVGLISYMHYAPNIDGGVIGFAVSDKGEMYFSEDKPSHLVKLENDELMEWIASDNGKTIKSFDASNDNIIKSFESGDGNDDLVRAPDIDAGEKGKIYVVEKDKGIIQILDNDLNPINEIKFDGGKPGGIALSKDMIYITDSENHQLVSMDRKGNIIKKVGELGRGEYQFYIPSKMEYDNGNLYIVDSGNQRLVIYDKDLVYIGEIAGIQSDMLGALFAPFFIAVSPDDNIAVTDPINNKVLIFDNDGQLLDKMGLGAGFSNEHFNTPAGIAYDANGRLYISDRRNSRVQIFNQDLTYSGTIPNIQSPIGISIGPDNRIYVLEDYTRTIKVYSPNLKLVGTIGKEQGLILPLAVLAGKDNKIYVIDDATREIKIFDHNLGLIEKITTANIIKNLGESLALNDKNELILMDEISKLVYIYNFKEKEYRNFDTFGSANDRSSMLQVATNKDGSKIFITDMQDARIKIFDSSGNKLNEIGAGKDGMIETFID